MGITKHHKAFTDFWWVLMMFWWCFDDVWWIWDEKMMDDLGWSGIALAGLNLKRRQRLSVVWDKKWDTEKRCQKDSHGKTLICQAVKHGLLNRFSIFFPRFYLLMESSPYSLIRFAHSLSHPLTRLDAVCWASPETVARQVQMLNVAQKQTGTAKLWSAIFALLTFCWHKFLENCLQDLACVPSPVWLPVVPGLYQN